MRERIPVTPSMQLLKSLLEVSDILSIVISSEIVSMEVFARSEQLASYAGTTPTVHSSEGKSRCGLVRAIQPLPQMGFH